jgi:hypothetical protein
VTVVLPYSCIVSLLLFWGDYDNKFCSNRSSEPIGYTLTSVCIIYLGKSTFSVYDMLDNVQGTGDLVVNTTDTISDWLKTVEKEKEEGSRIKWK